jgi:GNAT superfamily N-acetyltransferase
MSIPLPDPLLLIRDAVPADHPAIVEFNRLLAVETEHKVLNPAILDQGVARALAEPDRLRYWVVELPSDNGHRLIGQTAITREWSDWRNGWIWWLQSVYIQAEFRGQGVFKALYRHIYNQALASSSNVIGLRLYVENGNLRAQQTYQALGMKPGGYSVLEELWLHRSTVD